MIPQLTPHPHQYNIKPTPSIPLVMRVPISILNNSPYKFLPLLPPVLRPKIFLYIAYQPLNAE